MYGLSNAKISKILVFYYTHILYLHDLCIIAIITKSITTFFFVHVQFTSSLIKERYFNTSYDTTVFDSLCIAVFGLKLLPLLNLYYNPIFLYNKNIPYVPLSNINIDVVIDQVVVDKQINDLVCSHMFSYFW